MSVDPTPASPIDARFRDVFDQAPISMQLLASSGLTLEVNRAWEAMWQGALGDALKQYVLHGGYNVLTDPQLEAKGVTPYLLRAFAGEAVNIPAILYDPAELGITARPRWVTARAQPIKDDAGRVVEVMLMHEDITERVEADEILRQSEERFRSLVTASSQMVWTSDSDGTIVDDSPTWRAFTGQSYDEWKGVGWLHAIHPDDRVRAARVWRASVSTGNPYLTDYRVRRADGEYRWTSVHAVPLRRPDGSIREWIGTNTDVTDQRRTEEALRTSEQRLRFMFDSMQQKIFTTTPDGSVDYFNPAWTEFTGLAADTLGEWGWLQVVHPDDVDNSLRAWSDSLERRTAYEAEQRFLRADGQYRWHLSRAVPLVDDAGRVSMWIGSNTDIHEVKAAESELARRLDAERRHSAVLAKVAAASNQLHTAASADDIAGAVVAIVRDILGVHLAAIVLNADDNVAQPVNVASMSDKYAGGAPFVQGADGAGIDAAVRATNRPLRLTQAELPRQHDDAAPVRGWLAVPLKAHDGRNIGLLRAADKVDGDFTGEDEAILVQLASIAATGFENANLYKTLQEQHRRKDEFLAMLAHELRNPLAPIRAAADLLAIADLGDERIRQTSAVISRQVKHMSSLVDDLLDISRVTRGLIELAGTELDIKRIVADAVEQVRPLIEARLHEVTVTSAAEPAHVRGDHKRLVQVLANILNNAAKYTSRGGRIVVRTEATDSTVIVSVEDNGAGIPHELQPYVFDLFSQAVRSSDRTQGGLGIGLALVKSLIDLHAGQVTCHSDGAGAGSGFTITLPRLMVRAPVLSEPERPGWPASGTSRRKILIVDDNADAAAMLGMLLEAAGNEVLIEHTALRGFERAREDRPDVCIMDIGLPDFDGNELAQRMRRDQHTRGALLIAATGYGSDQDKSNALAAGFDYHLVKPIDTNALIRLLDDFPVPQDAA